MKPWDATIRVKVTAGLFPSERTVELRGGKQYFVPLSVIRNDELYVNVVEENDVSVLLSFSAIDGTKFTTWPIGELASRR